MKNLSLLSLFLLSLMAQAGDAPEVNVQKAIDKLTLIDPSPLTAEDQERLDSAKDKLNLALVDLRDSAAGKQIGDDLRTLLSLMGAMIEKPGYGGRPTLKSDVSVQVDVGIEKHLRKLGISVSVGGSYRFNGQTLIQAKFNGLKAEYLSVLGQAKIAGGQTEQLGLLSARSAIKLTAISQPDCASIFGAVACNG